MSPQSDILVVGAGLNGLLTARECLAAGLRVALVDHAAAAVPASWAAGGILSSLEPWRETAAALALARAGRGLYPSLVADLHRNTDHDLGYRACGMLVLDPENPDEVVSWAERYAEPYEWLEASGLAAAEPAVAGEYKAGVLLPEVHQIRNPRLLKALRESMAEAGVCSVTAADSVRLLVHESRCRGVEVDGVEHRAERVVLAAGAWSGQLLGDEGPALPVWPMRGQMLAYESEAGLLRHIVLQASHYLVPRDDGLILAGSTVEDVGFDHGTTETAAADLRAMAGRLVPALAGKAPAHQWSGLRPATADGLPYIGAHPAVAGLYLNYGHFRSGVLQAPASARLLADLMLDREPLLPPAAYDPARPAPVRK